jgi:hypothetical protein
MPSLPACVRLGGTVAVLATLRSRCSGNVLDFIMKVSLDGTTEFLNRAYHPIEAEQVIASNVFDYVPAEITKSQRVEAAQREGATGAASLARWRS